jgi:hypothetical protein
VGAQITNRGYIKINTKLSAILKTNENPQVFKIRGWEGISVLKIT